MDVSAGFVIPNAYGLNPDDMDWDMDSYRTALRFLSDLAGGTDERKALEANGGTVPMMRMWERSGKFRRVLAKCRAAAAQQKAALEARAHAGAEKGSVGAVPAGQRFIPFEDMPVNRSPFRLARNPDSFGIA